MNSKPCAVAAIVLSLSACVAFETERLPDKTLDGIQVSRYEPGADCRALGAVAGRAVDDTLSYQSAYDSLRNETALHGGNFVVIDLVTVAHDGDTVIRGRTFCCPTPDQQIQAQASGFRPQASGTEQRQPLRQHAAMQ